MTQVRILLDVTAVPDRPVGAGVYTAALAGALAQRQDVDLHLLARINDGERWRTIAPTATTHPHAPTRRVGRLAWEQASGPKLARAIAPDVWHGPHYTLPLRLAVPSVVTVHDLTFFDHPEWHERSKVLFFRRMIRASTQRADAIVAVSQHTADRIAAVLNPTAPVFVAAHGVDHDRFHATNVGNPDDLAILAAIGIGPPYCAFAGVFEPRKGLTTLVEAFARASTAHPDLRLVLAGSDGWGSRELLAAIERSGAATRILRPGYIPSAALPALFRQAEAVVYPSLEEGFGLPALEALACGAPLITTTGSAMAEFVGDAASLIAPGDIDALTKALNGLLDDEALSARLRHAGPPQAGAFTWSASAEIHMDAYRRAAGKPE